MQRVGTKRIALVGGGTGGHFYPLIATAERLNDLKSQGLDIGLYYLGPDPYNSDILAKNNINFIKIPAGKRRKYFSILNFLGLFTTGFGLIVAFVKLYSLYPDVIFSKGGFTSVPVVLAAWLLRIPIVIHESDSKVGTANKLAAPLARYIGISYDEAAEKLPTHKIALVGNPLQKTFMETPLNPIEALGLPADKPLIFITGGSLGSHRINNLILETLDELLPTYTILHQTGPTHEAAVKNAAVELLAGQTLLHSYFIKGTLTANEMHLAISGASLVISRAGSGSIFEIAHKGKPSIIIPIPETVSHDQRSNAYSYARTGAAAVLEETNLTDSLLTAEITRIMSDQTVYDAMAKAARQFARTDAAQLIANTLTGITNEHN